ncbi:MAG TPA: hypothetical protein VG318_06590 [Actinomycetota bacterium]|nr:hypothetical protein [Actinomycetota bacterium]
MHARNRRTARAVAAGALVVAACAAQLSPAAGGELGPPVLGYWTNDATLLADEDGAEVRRFQGFEHFSFSSTLLAGERVGQRADSNRVIGFDVATGERRFTIPDARLPVVAAGAEKVAFFPTFGRDEYGRSIWMRTPGGRIRAVAQFKVRGRPGIPHGLGGDGAPLDVALDRRGRYMAIAFGLEPLRSFDVWVIDTKTREATRMTRGERSHNPSLSPDGGHLAVRVERRESCPDPLYGEILIGKISVVAVSTGEAKGLTGHDCDVFYDTPRWIDDDTVLAVRVTKDAEEAYGYDLDIVSIDTVSGTISDLLTAGNPCCITTSPAAGKVAFGYSDRRGLGMLDVASGTVLDVDDDVFVPHLAGEGRL